MILSIKKDVPNTKTVIYFCIFSSSHDNQSYNFKGIWPSELNCKLFSHCCHMGGITLRNEVPSMHCQDYLKIF